MLATQVHRQPLEQGRLSPSTPDLLDRRGNRWLLISERSATSRITPPLVRRNSGCWPGASLIATGTRRLLRGASQGVRDLVQRDGRLIEDVANDFLFGARVGGPG